MAFIEKYLIYILLAIIAALAILGGIQYVRVLHDKTTIAKQAASILDLQKTNTDLNGQVADYKANIVAMQKTQAAQQKIANNTATLSAQAQTITANCILGVDDEKKIDNISAYFNAGGVLDSIAGNPKADEKVLPKTGKADAGHPVRQRYSVKQIVENYLTVIDYTLQLEDTVKCYESIN
jgi:cell division protein FtsB